ncbi:MAG: phage terminase small subunit-related protein [Candidatus Limiplasma sp.]|nr:phage terminase small subunit-related protein [Candidatus Limiplasma sp.]
MPKPRSPARDMAHRLWLDTLGRRPLTDIAAECGVSPELVRKWKAIEHWSLEDKKKSVPGVTESSPVDAQGNGNGHGIGNGKATETHAAHKAKGRKRSVQPHNPRGNLNIPPAPEGNKYAVTAGEFETILYETLSDTEKLLAQSAVQLPPVEHALRSLALLSVRESRILGRIRERLILAGETVTIGGGKMFALNALNIKTEGTDGAATKKQQVAYENVMAFVTDMEDALTRVQNSKVKVLDLLHRMQKDRLLTELEQRKVEAMEQRMRLEQKRFDFEYGRGMGEGANDPITGWLEATQPAEGEVLALFSLREDDAGEGSR